MVNSIFYKIKYHLPKVDAVAGSKSVIFSAFAFIVALILSGFIAFYSIKYGDYFPHGDTLSVDVFYYYFFDPDYFPLSLFSFYDNEHRPVFPLLIYFADLALFGSVGPLSQIGILVCNLALGLFPALITPASKGLAVRLAVAAVGLLVMFWAGHWENLQWPKQLHMYIALVSGLSAAWLLMNQIYPRRRRIIAAGILLFISCFSFAYGFFIAGALLTATLLRRQWRAAATISGVLGVGVVGYALLFAGSYQFNGTVRQALDIKPVLVFMLSVLGGPLATVLEETMTAIGWVAPFWPGRVEAAPFFGALGLAGYGFVALSLRRSASWNWFIAVIGLTAIATALSIAASRVDYGLGIAVNTSRYYVITGLFWAGLSSRVLWSVPAWGHSLAAAGRVVIVAGVAAVILLSTPGYLTIMRQGFAGNILGGAAGLSGLSVVVSNGFWLPEVLPALYDTYRAKQASVYRWPWARALGQPMSGIEGTTMQGDCPGAVVQVAPIANTSNGYRLEGTLPPGDNGWNWLLVTDNTGIVTGFGVTHVTPAPAFAPGQWTAFARGKNRPAVVYLLHRNGNFCRLGITPPTDGPVIPFAPPPFIATFETVQSAPAPIGIDCPDYLFRIRWLSGKLACVPRRTP